MKRTSLCYIFNNDRVLLLYRNKKENDPNEGKWIGVGGKLEEGETPQECALREVYEETGIRLETIMQRGLIRFVSEMWDDEEMNLFSAELSDEPELKECNEGRLAWIDAGKVMDLPMWEGDRYFLKPLLEGKEDINMTLIYEGKGSEEHLKEVKYDEA